jgi:hypothetical protein
MKTCNICGENKPQEAFPSNGKHYYKGYCKVCESAINRAKYADPVWRAARREKHLVWLQTNKERHIATCKKWKSDNAESMHAQALKHRRENVESIRLYAKEYAAQNKDKRVTWQMAREKAIKERTPIWTTELDLWLMEEAKELARLRTKVMGVKWVTDHIIPLQSPIVSGLHVPKNIRVVRDVENCRKHTKLDESLL